MKFKKEKEEKEEATEMDNYVRLTTVQLHIFTPPITRPNHGLDSPSALCPSILGCLSHFE